MPVDGSKRGTWVYTNDEETVFLFNGGFEKHKHQPPYDRSRGKIMLEVLDFSGHDEFLEQVHLDGVEPFTQLFIQHNGTQRILELVWDGTRKYIRSLEWKPFIRSSSTLYNADIRWQKQVQFEEWLSKHQPNEVLDFMQNTSFEVPIVLDHPLVQTISTTLVVREGGKNQMTYSDYLVAQAD